MFRRVIEFGKKFEVCANTFKIFEFSSIILYVSYNNFSYLKTLHGFFSKRICAGGIFGTPSDIKLCRHAFPSKEGWRGGVFMPLGLFQCWTPRALSVGVIENLFDVTCTSVNQHMSNGNSDITSPIVERRDCCHRTRFKIRAQPNNKTRVTLLCWCDQNSFDV